MNASDERQVAQRLTAMGYTARGIYGASEPAARPRTGAPTQPRAPAAHVAGMQAVTVASGVPVSVKSKVPTPRLAMFFRQLVTLVRSGVPLYQAFVDLASATRDHRLKFAISAMQEVLQSGQPLSSAMASHPDLFPAYTVASVWCGEMAGRLDLALEEIASDIETEASDQRLGRFGWALVKINLIFLILALPAYNLTNLVQPVLGDRPEDIERARNLGAMFWRDVIDGILRKSIPIVAATLLLWMVWGYVKRVPAARRLIDGALLRVPIWGKLHRYRSASRFLHVLDSLYEAGINPSRAWEAASITARNSEIAEKLRLARDASSQAAGITDLAALSKVLEPEDVSMISTGERTGQLPETLAKLSTIYAERAAAQKSAGRLLSISLMNAALIAMSGLAVAVIVRSYVSPIIKFLGI